MSLGIEEKIALVASVVLPLWNIPFIVRIIQRRSSEDISLSWALGVWTCFLLMFPSGLKSSDVVWRTFNIMNFILFSFVTFTILYFRRYGKRNAK